MADAKATSGADALEFWGSECVACLNTTADGMACDSCGSEAYTVPLYYDRKTFAERLALAEGVTS